MLILFVIYKKNIFGTEFVKCSLRDGYAMVTRWLRDGNEHVTIYNVAYIQGYVWLYSI